MYTSYPWNPVQESWLQSTEIEWWDFTNCNFKAHFFTRKCWMHFFLFRFELPDDASTISSNQHSFTVHILRFFLVLSLPSCFLSPFMSASLAVLTLLHSIINLPHYQWVLCRVLCVIIVISLGNIYWHT